MKLTKISLAITLAIYTLHVQADTYDSRVNLRDKAVQDGDIFIIENQPMGSTGVITAERDSTYTLNGKVTIDIKNVSGSGSGISISNSDNHNIGKGSSITIDDSGIFITALSLSNTKNFTSEDLTINVSPTKAVTYTSLSADKVTNAKFLGKTEINDSLLSNMSTLSIKKSDMDFDDLLITTGSYAITTEESKLVIKNLTINTDTNNTFGSRGLNLNKDNKITIKGNANINIKSKDGEVTGIFSTNSGNDIDLGKNSNIKIASQGFETYGIRTDAPTKIKATNLNIDIQSTGTTMGIIADKNSILNFDGLAINSNQGKSIAILADNTSTIDIKGKAIIYGTIAARRNATIDLNLSDSSYINGFLSNYSIQSNGIYKGTLNLKGSDTKWDLTENSFVNNLELTKNSSIHFKTTARGQLAADTLKGSINFNIRTFYDIDNDNNKILDSDQIIITKHSEGSHTLTVKNNGSAKSDGTEIFDNIVVNIDKKADFSLTHSVEIGGYLFNLKSKDGSLIDGGTGNGETWYLQASERSVTPQPETTNSAKASINALSASYLTNYVEQRNMNQRISSIRQDNNRAGLWINSYYGKLDFNGHDQLNGFDMKYKSFNIGADAPVYSENGSTWLLGAGVSYLTSDQDHRFGKGDLTSTSLNLYSTWLNTDGWYLDSNFKVSRFHNKVNVVTSDATQAKGSDTNYGWSLSNELGKRFTFTDQDTASFYAEPHVQLMVGQIGSSKFNNSNGLEVKVDKQNSVLTRTGSRFGYQVQTADRAYDVYAGISYAKEFAGKTDYYLNTSKEKYSIKNHWLEYSLGAAANFNQQHSAFIEYSTNSGNAFKQRQFNLGYKYSF